MRLHSLEITAFGAFGGTQKVDFDALGADGLFLLHGQTGAGKTTVLDAVAFALFGKVPGSRGDGKRLHSDHAAPGVAPRVMLEATIGGRALRLVRSPEYLRPKLRGDGEIKENAKGTLEWLDGSGENLSRHQDVGPEITRLLGMSADQFFQVVLLPQGEFANFLKAETKVRAALLEKLFNTSRFRSVEEWFAERKRTSADALTRQRQAIEVELASLATAAGVGKFAATEEQPAALGWAEALAQDSDLIAAAAEAALSTVRATAAAASKELELARGQWRAQARARDARAQLAAYEGGAAARAEMAEEDALAGRAEKVEWAHVALSEAVSERTVLTEQAAALEESLAVAPEVSGQLAQSRGAGGQLEHAVLVRAVRDWDAELTRLEQARATESAMIADSAALESVLVEISELKSKAADLTAQVEELPAKVKTVDAELEAARAAHTRVPDLAARSSAAAAIVSAAERLVPARDAQTQLAEKAQLAGEAHNHARELALDLRERRLSGMAAELAGQLVPGEACAVCGGTEHPAPAVAAENIVTKEAEDSAQATVTTAHTALEKARKALQQKESEIVQLRAESSGLGIDAAAAALADAKSDHEAAVRLAAAVEELQTKAASLQREQTSLREGIAQAATNAALAEQKKQQLTQSVVTGEAAIASMIGEDASVAARVDRIQAHRDGVERLAELLRLVESVRSAVDKAQAAVDEAVKKAGFASLAAALTAIRTQQRRAAISEALTAAAEQSASARAVLAEPEVAAAGSREPVLLDAFELADANAAAELEEAISSYTHADSRRRAVQAQLAGVGTEIAKLAPIEQRHGSLAALADVMIGDGQNMRRISLRTYVLAAKLEDVAVVASQRLRTMSGGRFEFAHSDGTIGSERRGGLALDVLDANTGSVRPTSTLSGGETFMASLSLALGLADVVAEETGGIQLETLFIDEGFGTLDADALDLVMGVLDELRAGGRSVGIVSHVAEMQHRIPTRLFVKKGEAGSTLQMIGA